MLLPGRFDGCKGTYKNYEHEIAKSAEVTDEMRMIEWKKNEVETDEVI